MEIVYPSENAIDDTNACRFSRNERSHLRKQTDERILPKKCASEFKSLIDLNFYLFPPILGLENIKNVKAYLPSNQPCPIRTLG